MCLLPVCRGAELGGGALVLLVDGGAGGGPTGARRGRPAGLPEAER